LRSKFPGTRHSAPHTVVQPQTFNSRWLTPFPIASLKISGFARKACLPLFVTLPRPFCAIVCLFPRSYRLLPPPPRSLQPAVGTGYEETPLFYVLNRLALLPPPIRGVFFFLFSFFFFLFCLFVLCLGFFFFFFLPPTLCQPQDLTSLLSHPSSFSFSPHTRLTIRIPTSSPQQRER